MDDLPAVLPTANTLLIQPQLPILPSSDTDRYLKWQGSTATTTADNNPALPMVIDTPSTDLFTPNNSQPTKGLQKQVEKPTNTTTTKNKQKKPSQERESLPETLVTLQPNKGFPLLGKVALGVVGLAGVGMLFHHFKGGTFFENFGKKVTTAADERISPNSNPRSFIHPNSSEIEVKATPESSPVVKAPEIEVEATSDPILPVIAPEPTPEPILPVIDPEIEVKATPVVIASEPTPKPILSGKSSEIKAEPEPEPTPKKVGFTPKEQPLAKTITGVMHLEDELSPLLIAVRALETTRRNSGTIDIEKAEQLKDQVTLLANKLVEEQLANVLAQKRNFVDFISGDWHTHHAVLGNNDADRLRFRFKALPNDLGHLKNWVDKILLPSEEESTPEKELKRWAKMVDNRPVFKKFDNNYFEQLPDLYALHESHPENQPYNTYNAAAVAEMLFIKYSILLLGAGQDSCIARNVQNSLGELETAISREELFSQFEEVYNWSQTTRGLIEKARAWLEIGKPTVEDGWNGEKKNLLWHKNKSFDPAKDLKYHYAQLFNTPTADYSLLSKIAVLQKQAEALEFLIDKRTSCDDLDRRLKKLINPIPPTKLL